MKIHLDILDEKRQELLKRLPSITNLDQFYMAGGTALSLQLKLRDSEDFDFFTKESFEPSLILEDISSSGYSYKVLQNSRGTLNILVDGIKLQFLQYPYNVISLNETEIQGIRLASIDDISAMKLAAIGSRGSRKDFFDLYGIYQLVEGFNSEKLIDNVLYKFGKDVNLSYMQMGLVYFKDAKNEILPKTYIDYNWEDIESFFEKESLIIKDIIEWV